ncbi:MAG: ZIP family metal transporter [Candidatus Wildermuthbacteria bacterium]|nr:ZIP family metal transporter [Candidatus Wildermuthbacteria bacterium]
MPALLYILAFTFVGSIGALAGGLVLLAWRELAAKVSHALTAFAAGALLGAAFFDLLPEAVHGSEETGANVFLWTLTGIILFFFIEHVVHWRHHHDQVHEHARETMATAPLIIISDTVHNFIDGIIIAITFLINIPLGIVTALAVIAHEIPQEIGDFALLLHKGFSRKMVVLINVLSAAVALIGALLGYVFGSFLQGYIPILLGLTAGFFIYIATSDIMPEIHYKKRRGFAVAESILLVSGIVAIYSAVSFFGHAE